MTSISAEITVHPNDRVVVEPGSGGAWYISTETYQGGTWIRHGEAKQVDVERLTVAHAKFEE